MHVRVCHSPFPHGLFSLDPGILRNYWKTKKKKYPTKTSPKTNQKNAPNGNLNSAHKKTNPKTFDAVPWFEAENLRKDKSKSHKGEENRRKQINTL